jgi:hypothetical protein
MKKTLTLLFAITLSATVLAKGKRPKPQPPRPPVEKPAEKPNEPPSGLPALGEKPPDPVVPPAPPPTPAPAPVVPVGSEKPPVEKPAEAKERIDLEQLSGEYHALRDELFRSRAKVEMLGAALYKTKMLAMFQYKAQRAWPLKKVMLRLDDNPVYTADAPQAEEPIKLWEGFAAAGRHSVGVRVECGAQGDSRLSYSAESTFVFDVEDNRLSKIEITVDESGDGPQPIAKKKEGTFDVKIKARVRNLKPEAK